MIVGVNGQIPYLNIFKFHYVCSYLSVIIHLTLSSNSGLCAHFTLVQLFDFSFWCFDFFVVCGTQQLDVHQKPPGQAYHQSAEHPEVYCLQWDLFNASNSFYVVQVGNIFCHFTQNWLLAATICPFFWIVQVNDALWWNVVIINYVLYLFFDSGQGSLLLPFIYYRFLTLRYTSRRNPYCRWVVNMMLLLQRPVH